MPRRRPRPPPRPSGSACGVAGSPAAPPTPWPPCPSPPTSTGGSRPMTWPGLALTRASCTQPVCSTRRPSRPCSPGWRHCGAMSSPGRSCRPRAMRTSTPRWSGGSSSAPVPRSADACGPVAPATTRSRRSSGCTCATTRAPWAGSSSTSSMHCWPSPAPTSGSRCPAAPTSSTPSPSCSRTTCWPTSGRCCATSSGWGTGIGARRSRPTGPAPWPAPRSDWTPSRWPPTSASTGPPTTRSTAPPRGTSSRSSPSSRP